MRRLGLLIALLVLVLSGCARQRFLDEAVVGPALELDQTPFFPQEEYQCGPASLAMLLGASGIAATPDELAPLTYLPERRGSLQLELIGASRRFGRIPYIIDPQLDALVAELRQGRPVLVLQNYGLESLPVYHYSVVIGMRPDETVILRSGTDRRLEMSAASFMMSWKRPGSWGLVVLKPGDLPARPDRVRYLQAVNGYEKAGRPADTLAAYRAALTRWPDDPDTLFALATDYFKLNQPGEAESLYRRILAIAPDHLAAANNLADLLGRRGCYREAAALIERAARVAEEDGSPLSRSIEQTRRELKDQIDSGAADKCTESR